MAAAESVGHVLDSNIIFGYPAGKIPDFKNIADLTVVNPWDIETYL